MKITPIGLLELELEGIKNEIKYLEEQLSELRTRKDDYSNIIHKLYELREEKLDESNES